MKWRKTSLDNDKIKIYSKAELCQASVFWMLNIFLWLMLYGNLCIRHQSDFGDYYLHNQFAELLLEGKLFLMYPGYHILVGMGILLFGINTCYVSTFVLSVSACLSVYVTYKLLEKLIDQNIDSRILLLIIAFLLNIIQPIFVPGIAPGYSSGNGYISPTQIVCKPVALWSILIFYTFYKEQKWELRGQTKLTFVLILSCLLKPLFAMAFVPAMGGLLGIEALVQYKSKEKTKWIIVYLREAWPLILTGCFLIIQYLYSLKIEQPTDIHYQLSIGENSHIQFGFMHAWSMVVSNVWLSILFAYFFPLVTVILLWYCEYLNIKNWLKSKYVRMCLAYGMVSFFYISCLYQDNGFETHMNFRNSWAITFSMIYCGVVAMVYKMKRTEKIVERKRVQRSIWIAGGVFIVQVFFGVVLLTKNIFF